MSKAIYKLLLSGCVTICLMACTKSASFELRAEMEGLHPTSPILVVYDDPISKIDTIYPEKGKFTYSLALDTLQLLRLVSDSGKSVPIFANKSWKVDLKGSFASPIIKGDGPNDEYGQFRESISHLQTSEATTKAEEFIRLHPNSHVSAYLINQYFVQVASPNTEKIEQLIEPLTGEIKDSRILSTVLKAFPSENNTSKTYLTYTSIKDRSGKYVSWKTDAKYSLVLINLWASWDEASINERNELEKLMTAFKKNEFRVLNVSLDYSRQDWERVCKKDSIQWIETCDFKGWDNSLIKQLNIKRLPYNILVDGNRKIVATNLYGEELKAKALELIKESKDKEIKK